MKTSWMIPLAILQIVGSTANAVDLTKVPRTIGDEPEYQTKPKYGLLVFGPGAARTMWLVHDGDTLYADLDGDGNLTDPAERFAAHEDSNADDGTYVFEVGEVREGDALHKSLTVGTLNLQHLADSDARVRTALSKDPQARFYRLGIDLQMPLHRGAGIDGRVEHLVGPIDNDGLLRFANSPEKAPIVHFGGPWQITFYSGAELTTGRQTEVVLAMGTPGVSPGTTAFAAYQGLVPDGVDPKLHITFAGRDDSIEYVLTERCCTVNFHDGVRLREDAPLGEATVKITLDDWLGGAAAPTTHKVQVVEPKFQFTLEPISPRLKRSLMHTSRHGMIVGIRYSPDGTRIVAGDYPGGVVQSWDVETGNSLGTLETGPGYRGSYNYFHLTPDWHVVSTPTRTGKATRVERDDKAGYRWEFEGGIRCQDPATGELLWKLQHSPPRGIIATHLSPDGKYILSLEEPPGEFDGRPERRLSLWNTQTQTLREFSEIYAYSFSDDSSRFAASRKSEDGYEAAVEVYDVETAERTISIAIAEQPAWLSLIRFTPDGTQLIGQVSFVPDRKTPRTYQSSLKFWDAATGEEVGSIDAVNEGDRFFGPGNLFSPDGRTCVLGNWSADRTELYLINLADRQMTRTIDLGEKLMIRGQAFSPDGRWIAAATQHIPENTSDDASEQDLPQPKIHLIEAATGEIRETIVAPQSFMASLCFSPDGKTLATSGPGRVLLWDLSIPPGEPVKP